MAETKRIICLANSRKRLGRCVAGKEQLAEGIGGWVRPVSTRNSQEISEQERQYRDRSDPRVLDIIDISVLEHRPHSHQTENWLLNPESSWVRIGRGGWLDLFQLMDKPEILWVNSSSTYSGLNDRVAVGDAQALTGSLYLLHLRQMTLSVLAPGSNFGNPKRRVQAAFSHNAERYRLWVTDPTVESRYLAGQDGEFNLGECFVTVSLGEVNDDGYCYKLVATVIMPENETP